MDGRRDFERFFWKRNDKTENAFTLDQTRGIITKLNAQDRNRLKQQQKKVYSLLKIEKLTATARNTV